MHALDFTLAQRFSRRSALFAFGVSAILVSKARGAIAQSDTPAAPPLVVSASDVMSMLQSGSDEFRFVDASSLRDYRSAHLPGATHAFWEDTVDANYPVFGAVVTQGFEQQQRLEIIRRFGVLPEQTIVVYDREGGFRAARIVWFLRFLGFPKVAMLDGGIGAWQAYGGTSEPGVIEAPDIEPRVDPLEGFYVVTEALRQRLELGDSLIVDVRTDEERQGTLDGQIPIGQIPGSLRLPWSAMIDPDSGMLRDKQSLLTQVETAGVTGESDIVVVARFGAETALSWLVMNELGFERVLTYDRGWVEWASTPGLPVEPPSS